MFNFDINKFLTDKVRFIQLACLAVSPCSVCSRR